MVTEIQGFKCGNCLGPFVREIEATRCCNSAITALVWRCDSCQKVHPFRNAAGNCAPACQKCQHCGTPRDQWPKGDE